MSDSARPTITSDHRKKYDEIMGLEVKPASQSSAPAPAGSNSTSKSSSILSSILRPKGLGNKMFIFTGKKKIIMEGTQRRVETAKTVNPTPVKAAPEEKKEHAKKEEAKPAANLPAEKSKQKKPIPLPIRIVLVFGFFCVYTFVWLIIFGYINF